MPLLETLDFIELGQLGESTSLANRALLKASAPKIHGECTFHAPCLMQNGHSLCQQNRFLPDLCFDKIDDFGEEKGENEEEDGEEKMPSSVPEDGCFNVEGKTVLKNENLIMPIAEVPPPRNIVGFKAITLR